MDDLTRLLRSAAGGDHAVLEEFVRRTQADVWRFCAHLVDPATADDLTQEVYLRALSSISGFRGDSSARTWLLSVARHVAADEIRRRQRRRRTADTAVHHDPVGDRAEPADTAVEVSELIDRLDDDRRVAFVLTQVLGLSYAEAAAACEVPIGTIRSRVARARRDLVEMLGWSEDHTARPDRASPHPRSG